MGIFNKSPKLGVQPPTPKYYTSPGSHVLPPTEPTKGATTGTSVDGIARILSECNISCSPVKLVLGPATIQYHMNLRSLSDHSKLTRAVTALSARIRKQAIIQTSDCADFALSVPRDEKDLVTLKRCLDTDAYHNVRGNTGAVLGLNENNLIAELAELDITHPYPQTDCEYCRNLCRYKVIDCTFRQMIASDEIIETFIDTNYCPNCGRKLESEDNCNDNGMFS